jgi:glycosyltransferase involved in cell wall biosynthesis
MRTIAIGVHAHAEPAELQATLDYLRRNTNVPFSLLLLPDGPDAEMTAALVALADIPQFATEYARGGAACFNRLVANTESEIVILLESGARVAPGWLEHLLHALETDCTYGLAGPSTNLSWNEQGAFPGAGGSDEEIRCTALEAARRFRSARRTLEPLYSLADFCYLVRREVFTAVGEADESYHLGPCWEMDYNIRAVRAGFRGVWACASYVYRAPFTERRLREEELQFEASRRRYQDKFCGRRLRGETMEYRTHCRGDACPNFAPLAFVAPASLVASTPSCRLDACPPAAPDTPPSPDLSSSSLVPLVSCIMPTHDRRAFVVRAIDCFRQQDYPNLELIVVDDGTAPIEDLIVDDSRIRYLRLERKLTVGAKRNYACERARGDVIVHWDDDDWYPPRRVRVQVCAMLEKRADISGTSRLYYYDTTSGRAFRYQYEGQPRWVAGNTLAYRRDFWRRHPFQDLQVGEDSQFIWAAPHAVLVDLKDHELCIGAIHAENVSPKNTSGPFWRPESPGRIRALLGQASDHQVRPHVPLVSCIMPTSNRRAFIPLALTCFRAQTYSNKELVVIDDGSDPVADLLQDSPDVRYVRIPQRLTIGAKRNLACREAQGEIIAHWDDDDWYAPDRLERQIAPIAEGQADMTGLANRFVLEMPLGQFWTTTDHLHRRMFVGDVHGGTLVYSRSILNGSIRYPEINLAEDAFLIREALRRNKRLLRLENSGSFVYLRHARNAWRFETGRFIDPSGWQQTTAPHEFPIGALDSYRAAASAPTK